MSTQTAHRQLRAQPDRRRLRRVLGAFATGVTVVTTRVADRMHGMTANAFTSVCLDPPVILVCLTADGQTCDAVQASGVFAVNILGADQQALSLRFGAAGRPRGQSAFCDLPHRIGASGAPILDGVAAFMDCRTVASHVVGDHRVFLAQVTDLDAQPGAVPLIFHDGRYGRLA